METSAETENKLRQIVAPQHSPNDSPAAAGGAFPIVGIGASAGGLEALERFFTHLPPDSGMAFVIVQHLDPTHKSILTDLLKKFTSMLVMQVEDQIPVQPNQVYVIPPNTQVTLQDGTLQLAQPTKPRGLRLPIDHFFRSLATEQKEKAICIILSGTGTDGTLGLKAIKEKGGLAVVQAPHSARYDGMPLSAIHTGLVDMVLAPEEIAEQLIPYTKRSFGTERQQAQQGLPDISTYLQKILELLESHTGHDFSGYKENTIARRIERRVTINQMTQMEDYLQYLQRTPLERETLFRELLIGVTSFFRDPQAFDQLAKKVIVPLFANPNPKRIRVWVPGCSTGEEAHSVAILLREQMERSNSPVEIQVFATDIDRTAINKARDGRYPDSIVADVTPERLKRFFVQAKDRNFYRVNRQIRDTVIFAEQSVIKDPPFSKLDLICCRNLMIYLEPDLQQRLLALFHYALNPGGYLFLGNSETLGKAQKLFQTLDRKWRIFKRVEFVADMKTIFDFSGDIKPKARTPDTLSEKPVGVQELTEQLLPADHTPTSILINEKGEMLYVHGNTGKYLEQSTGKASTNILRIAREGLRMPLSTAVRNATTQKRLQVVKGVSMKHEGGTVCVKLTVAPVLTPPSIQGLLLVTLTEMPSSQSSNNAKESDSTDYAQAQHTSELEQELKSTREYLQTLIEELETTNEELKSANEELQSANEELQSTNEELQTSKEELQSVNEELVTVNTELQVRVDELTAANNDIKNLMESARVGIIFLDTNLRIRRFTESSRQMIELIPEDVGRPLKQFVHKLRYKGLNRDTREVLKTQTTKKIEVQSEDGHWYLLRIMPYRTVDDHIAGVVLTLTNVTQIKQTEEALRESEENFRSVVECSPDIIFTVDQDLQIKFINRVPPGLSVEQALETSCLDYVQPAYRVVVETAIRQVFATGVPTFYQIEARGPNETTAWYFTRLALMSVDTNTPQVLLITQDITKRKLAEGQRETAMDALRESEAILKGVFDSAPDAMIILNKDGQIILSSAQVHKLFGYTAEELSGKTVEMLMPERFWDIHYNHRREFFMNPRTREMGIGLELIGLHKNGREFPVEVYLSYQEVNKETIVVSAIRDITERKQAEEEILRARKLESVGVLAGGIAHDFNNLLTVLSGNIELAKLALSPIHPAYQHLEKASYVREKATSLAKQLLTFAKGGAPIKEIQDIGQLLVETATFVTHGSKSELNLQVAPDLWLAEVDQGQISQVISNLMINARQAMPDGGTITLEAANVESDGQPYIKITIKDEGVGIAPENLDKIFDPYFSTKSENSGLGLATVHSIVTKHNGQITVSSQLQQGTTFTILLPAKPKALPLSSPISNEEPDSMRVGSARILVVDDMEDVRLVLEDALTYLGHQTTLVKDGKDAIAAYQTAMQEGIPYQVVILDLTIPGRMDGQETAQKILDIDPQARLIVSSGYANSPIMANYKDYGFKARIPKPFQLETLQKALETILA